MIDVGLVPRTFPHLLECLQPCRLFRPDKIDVLVLSHEQFSTISAPPITSPAAPSSRRIGLPPTRFMLREDFSMAAQDVSNEPNGADQRRISGWRKATSLISAISVSM